MEEYGCQKELDSQREHFVQVCEGVDFTADDVTERKEQGWVMECGHKVWRNAGSVRHRENGPAVEYSDGTTEWWIEGRQLTEAEFNSR